MLVAVIFLLAAFILAMSIAAPQVAKEIQRDRDVETMHRGKQYIRAIQLYYRKFNAYPPNIDALVKTNEIRFLRKKYIDPTTRKDEWKPIAFGQNKVPIVYGFFGQPLAASTMAGIGPTGGNGVTGANSLLPGGGSGVQGSGNIGINGTNAAGGSGIDATNGNSADPNAQNNTGSNGTGQSSTGSSGLSGQTFGGAGIIGFSPQSPEQSILVYKKKNHYNEWEFTYDPMMEQIQMMGGSSAGPGGQPAGGVPTYQQQQNNSPFGGNSTNGTPTGGTSINGTTTTTQ